MFHFRPHIFDDGICDVSVRFKEMVQSETWWNFSDDVISVWNHLLDGVRHLEIGFSWVLGKDPILNGDVKSRKHFVCCPNDQVTLVLTETIAKYMQLLQKRDINGHSRRCQAAEFTESRNDSCLHRGNEPYHRLK